MADNIDYSKLTLEEADALLAKQPKPYQDPAQPVDYSTMSLDEADALLERQSTRTGRWGIAWDDALNEFKSPEVTEAYKEVEGWYDDPYTAREEYGPGLDPVTSKAVGQRLGEFGSDVWATIAGNVDMAGEKLGIRKDELPDIPLMDQQYLAAKKELESLEKRLISGGTSVSYSGLGATSGMMPAERQAITTRMDELKTQMSNIEANDPDVATRFIPSNPSIEELKDKYRFYEATSPVAKAQQGLTEAALYPVSDYAGEKIEQATEDIEDPLEKRYAQEAIGNAVELGTVAISPVAGKVIGKTVGGAANVTGKVAGATGNYLGRVTKPLRDRISNIGKSKTTRIEDRLAEIQRDIDEIPAIARELRNELPDDPDAVNAIINDLKAGADDLRVERAKLNVQLAREKAKSVSDGYKGWIERVRGKSAQGSGVKAATNRGGKWANDAKSAVGSAILDGIAAKVTGGASLIFSGGNATRIVMREGSKSFKDWYRLKGQIEIDSDIPAPKLGDADLDALIKQLPAEQQAVINDYLNGKAKPAEVVDTIDKWVNDKKTGDDWLKEQADIEADAERAMQEEAMFRQRERDMKEQADIEADAERVKQEEAMFEQERIRKRDERRNREQADIEKEWREQDPSTQAQRVRAEENIEKLVDEAQAAESELYYIDAKGNRRRKTQNQIDMERAQAEGGQKRDPNLRADGTPRGSNPTDNANMANVRQSKRNYISGESQDGINRANPYTKAEMDAAGAGEAPPLTKAEQARVDKIAKDLAATRKTPNQQRQQTLEDFEANPPKGSNAPKKGPDDAIGMVAKVDMPSPEALDKMTKAERQDWINRKNTQERSAADARSNPTFKEIFEEKPKTPAEEALATAVEKVIFEKKLTSDIGGEYYKVLDEYTVESTNVGTNAETILRQVARDARRQQQGLDIPEDSPVRTLVDEPDAGQIADARDLYLDDVRGDLEVLENAANALDHWDASGQNTINATTGKLSGPVQSVSDLVDAAREVYATVNKNKPDNALSMKGKYDKTLTEELEKVSKEQKAKVESTDYTIEKGSPQHKSLFDAILKGELTEYVTRRNGNKIKVQDAVLEARDMLDKNKGVPIKKGDLQGSADLMKWESVDQRSKQIIENKFSEVDYKAAEIIVDMARTLERGN